MQSVLHLRHIWPRLRIRYAPGFVSQQAMPLKYRPNTARTSQARGRRDLCSLKTTLTTMLANFLLQWVAFTPAKEMTSSVPRET
ncbi:hypothetical protein HYDPIDRAFT_116706 [Hydnomerulius pinastri MD-312]|uniref:Uncharacterized protein n=1 Tax=Hydnomerulius pinastri MD-312 TaxID=994086 RepID=A0A0C9VSH1_9AGAM|nr:hypothetical protein HYDPIDRAFT_116706 [Hydnomerulius pinastri MD-312]